MNTLKNPSALNMAGADVDDVEMEEEYDEEADSDFEAVSVASAEATSSSDDEKEPDAEAATRRPKKRRKAQTTESTTVLELDSGDEATIKDHHKARRKQRREGVEEDDAGSGEEDVGWRAKTRAMRERDKDDKKRGKLASTKSSTIDVNRIWEEMNSPSFISQQTAQQPNIVSASSQEAQQDVIAEPQLEPLADKENAPSQGEMITIKRTYKFAGEMHTEEKTVLKSSAEGRLWLAQQATKPQTHDAEGRVVHRPLRKVSRFDPNVHDLGSFKGSWTTITKGASGPKLNVVEKSKMDWASHVDAEGLKEELDTHAKAKEGYMHRIDFLREVEQRKEEEARAARLQGRS